MAYDQNELRDYHGRWASSINGAAGLKKAASDKQTDRTKIEKIASGGYEHMFDGNDTSLFYVMRDGRHFAAYRAAGNENTAEGFATQQGAFNFIDTYNKRYSKNFR